jgi:cysteine desulfurase
MSTVYLDHAATTPLDPHVREAMRPYYEEQFGNPSSRHPLGVRAARALQEARRTVARALLVEPQRVLFTSGGTEALNLAVLGIARAARNRGRRVVVGPTEHACVRGAAAALAREGFEIVPLALDAQGELDLDDAAAKLTPDTVVVAQMLANNEFGTLYPVQRLARLARTRSPQARIVVDAVQAVGKLDCAPAELGVDAVAFSAHKLHGPKGAGALVLATDIALEPLVHGGGQEHGLRSGTENVAACVGLAAALELAEGERHAAMRRWHELRERLLAQLARLGGVRVLEPGLQRLPTIVSILWRGAPAEVRMHHLERLGVFVSAGSACQAAKRELSPALRAIGLSDEDARSTLRLSMGRTTTADDVERAATAFEQVARELEHVVR